MRLDTRIEHDLNEGPRTDQDSPFKTMSAVDIELAARRTRPETIASALMRAAAAIGQAVSGLMAAIRDRHARRKTYAELMALTDRELSDIGLSRGDVPGVANGMLMPRQHGLQAGSRTLNMGRAPIAATQSAGNHRTKSPSKAA
jgi:uncharacterized protein YjiS (DUF1127 family)